MDGTEEMVAALKRPHPPGSGSKHLRIPARLRRDAEKFRFMTLTASKAASMKPCMSREAEVENAERLAEEGVTGNGELI